MSDHNDQYLLCDHDWIHEVEILLVWRWIEGDFIPSRSWLLMRLLKRLMPLWISMRIIRLVAWLPEVWDIAWSLEKDFAEEEKSSVRSTYWIASYNVVGLYLWTTSPTLGLSLRRSSVTCLQDLMREISSISQVNWDMYVPNELFWVKWRNSVLMQ